MGGKRKNGHELIGNHSQREYPSIFPQGCACRNLALVMVLQAKSNRCRLFGRSPRFVTLVSFCTSEKLRGKNANCKIVFSKTSCIYPFSEHS